MTDLNAILLIGFSAAWLVLCAMIAYQIERDLRVAKRREKTLRERMINGDLSMIAESTTRATTHDRWCIYAFTGAALLTLVIRYIDFLTSEEVDVVLRYLVTAMFVTALIPFYMRVKERRDLASEFEKNSTEARQLD